MLKRTSGFTLIELLVVIAVISVLAAILFPVMAQARAKARQTTCANSTRQLAFGILMYAQDYDETLPPVAYEIEIAENEREILWPEMVAPYLKNEPLRRCLEDVLAKENSFGLNELAFADLSDETAERAPIHSFAAFRTPAENVMLGDIGTEDNFRTNRPDAFKMVAPSFSLNDEKDARPAARHFQNVNLAFIDGHQKQFRLDQFYTGQTPPDRWFQP